MGKIGKSRLKLYTPVEYYDYVMKDGVPDWKWRSGYFVDDSVPEDQTKTTYKVVDKRVNERYLLRVEEEKVHNKTAKSVQVTLQIPILTCHDPQHAKSNEWINKKDPNKFTVELCNASNVRLFAKVFPKS